MTRPPADPADPAPPGPPPPGPSAGPPGPLAAVGGPLGRYAAPRASSWPALVAPLLAAAGASMALSVAARSHCISTGWNGQDQFWHACFSDLPALYRIGRLDAGLPAYLAGTGGTHADHPVLTGAVMSALGGLVPAGPVLDQTRWYFGLWAVLATVLVLAIVYLTAAARPLHAADAAHVALSPVLVLAGLVSADIVGVALASAGLWAWGRRRPELAGVLLGLGVMARTYPLLILLALLLLGLRAGRLRAVGRTLLAAVVAAAIAALPFLLGNLTALTRAVRAWWNSQAGLGSPWIIPQLLGHPLPSTGVTLLALVGILLAMLAGAVFALSTWRRPTVPEVALVLVALVLVTGKSFPVQASLWLVPLVALCGLHWRHHLVWAGAEALHFVAVWLYVGGLSTPDRGMPPEWYGAFLTIRVAAVLYLAWQVWRTAALRPEAPEPVVTLEPEEPAAALASSRGRVGDDLDRPSHSRLDPDSDAVVDELAGEFADAPDRFLVRFG